MEPENMLEAKEALFAAFEKSNSAERLVHLLWRFAEFFKRWASERPDQVLAWGRDLLKRMLYRYSDADQIRFDKTRQVARAFSICYEIEDLLEEITGRLQPA